MLKKALTLGLLTLGSAYANSDGPLFYWDNQEGLVNATHCEVKTLDSTAFRISQYTGRGTSLTENLRNSKGVRQSHLINGSVLSLEKGKGKPSYYSVRVLGMPLLERGSEHRWYTDRGDRGFLYEHSLRPIESYVLNPKNISSQLISEDLTAASWKVPKGPNYLQVICPEHQKNRQYLVFEVQETQNKETKAYVGVHHQESSIFSAYSINERSDDEFYDNQRISDELLHEFSEQTLALRPLPRPERFSSANKSVQLPTEVVKQESLKQVVCLSGTSLNIRDESLENVIFKAYNGDVVVVAQGFDNEVLTNEVNGEKFEFLKVSFANKEGEDQRIGYAAKNFISAESHCPFINLNPVVRGPETTITGLDDKNCCEFPTVRKTTHPFTSGMQMFGARRGGGTRSHAAADLYRYIDEPILAVAPGTVVRDLYFFYQGTYALEVVHSGGFVVRYGEITNKAPPGVKRGASLKMGERLGFMGVVNSGCCRPMLHFELFRGNRTGSLSQTNPPYNRRSDLINPTPYLLKWEREKF